MTAEEVFTCPCCGEVLEDVCWDAYGQCWYYSREDGEFPVLLLEGKVMAFKHGEGKYCNDEYIVLHGH